MPQRIDEPSRGQSRLLTPLFTGWLAPHPVSMAIPQAETLNALVVLNLVLQVFDGVATYGGIRLGVEEANPLLRNAFAFWGVGPALLLLKTPVSGALLLIGATGEPFAEWSLRVSASVYCLVSLIPGGQHCSRSSYGSSERLRLQSSSTPTNQ